MCPDYEMTHIETDSAASALSAGLERGKDRDSQLTAIYNEANGITGKRLPITTARIFTAMRAAIAAEREACAKVCDQHAENMARHGDTELAEQSRQDSVAIRARSNAHSAS